MNTILKAIAIIPAAALLLLPMARANEAVCVPQKVKKVSRLCVSLIDQSGAPVPNAILIVCKDGMEIAQGTTGANGKFSFDDLKRGSYTVEICAEGFDKDQFPIVITNPSKKCKHAVQVLLYIGWLPCRGMVHLVKP
jgi:hypothetical protein